MNILETTAHRPWPMPVRPWRLRQAWNDLLFAHWPIPAAEMQTRLPAGLEVDTFDGSAWLGVVPFWMNDVRTRSFGERTFGVPSTSAFAELNLRTYVRSRVSGRRGVFFFALDCESPLAVLGARTIFHLPYFPAVMSHRESAAGIEYTSRRWMGGKARFEATYRPLGAVQPPSAPGAIEHFLTERYTLFTPFAGRMLRGEIHHLPWPLQRAEASFRRNELPEAHGFTLPAVPPVLHFARRLEVFLWSLKPDDAKDEYS